MNQSKKDKIAEKKKKNERWLFFGVITIIAIIIEVISGVVMYFYFKGDWDKASKFGDSFGATSTLFSGIALAGVIYTLILQKKAIEEQKNQFKKADEDFKLTHENREKTFSIFQMQVNELSRAAEIQAIQLSLNLLDSDVKSVSKKEIYRKRLNTLLKQIELEQKEKNK